MTQTKKKNKKQTATDLFYFLLLCLSCQEIRRDSSEENLEGPLKAHTHATAQASHNIHNSRSYYMHAKSIKHPSETTNYFQTRDGATPLPGGIIALNPWQKTENRLNEMVDVPSDEQTLMQRRSILDPMLKPGYFSRSTRADGSLKV